MNVITKKAWLLLVGSFILGACQQTSQPKSLVEAVRAGDMVVVTTFLSKGADANSKDENGTPVLLIAAGQRDKKIVEALLQAGANVNDKDANENTTLMIAAEQGDENIVESLLQAGANVNDKDANGNTALMIASTRGHINVIIDLLNANANLYEVNNEGKSVLTLVEPHQGIIKMLFLDETMYILDAVDKYYVTNGMVKAGTLDTQIRTFYRIICDSSKSMKYYRPNVVGNMCTPKINRTWIIQALDDGLFEVSKTVVHWVISDALTLDMRQETTVYTYIVDVNRKTIGAKDSNACVMLNAKVAPRLIEKQRQGIAVDFSQECKFPITLQEETDTAKKAWRQTYRTNSEQYLQLLDAIQEGDTAKVAHLIKAGVNVSERPKTFVNKKCEKCPPLMLASRLGHSEIIQMLLNAGAHIDDTEERLSDTALILAIYDQHVDAVNTLLRAKANVHHKNKHEATALVIASIIGNAEIVKSLLVAGANVNEKNENGMTPLLWASQKGHTEVVKILLEAGADVTAEGRAYSEEKKGLQEAKTALQYASEKGYTDVVNVLLGARVDINKRNQYGQTALMEVIQSGNTNMVRDLLNAGAKIDTKDAGGRTALMYAKDVSVINVLLENGANVNDTDAWGNTALFYASEKGDVEVVKTLLAAGADVNNKSNKSYQGLIWESHSFGSNRTEKLGGAGWTAIMVASREGKVEAVKELLNAGANVNNVSEDGWTALMAASLGNYPDVVRVLLQGKANVNYKNKRGQTALSFAPSEAMDRLFGGSGASVGVATLLKKAGAR